MGELIQLHRNIEVDEEDCEHKDDYGSTIIMGSNPTKPPICILCDKEFPKDELQQ